MSREIAASSCIILQDMYVENSQGELKHVCGIKREYPEPKLLDFSLSTHNKPQRQRFKYSINSPFGNVMLPLELALDFPEEERMMQQSSVSISLSF